MKCNKVFKVDNKRNKPPFPKMLDQFLMKLICCPFGTFFKYLGHTKVVHLSAIVQPYIATKMR